MQLINTITSWLSTQKSIFFFFGKENHRLCPKWGKKTKREKKNKNKKKKNSRNKFKSRADLIYDLILCNWKCLGCNGMLKWDSQV